MCIYIYIHMCVHIYIYINLYTQIMSWWQIFTVLDTPFWRRSSALPICGKHLTRRYFRLHKTMVPATCFLTST